MRKLLVPLLLCFHLLSSAQDVNGYWYGSANIANGSSTNNYMMEVLMKQSGTSVQAILNYYFRNTFRSFKINGNYNSFTRQVALFNIPVTYYGSPINMEVDCPMDLMGQLRVSKVGSFLKGSFVSKGKYRNTCPEVFFELKMNKDAGNQDSILTALKLYKEVHQVWSPNADDTLISVKIQQRAVVNYVISDQYKKRETVLAKEIVVASDSVSVDFYDNGEVDGDSISVFFNNQLLTFNRMLSTKAIHFQLALDTTKEVNEIVMFANNLGTIPPNTALMIVWDGKTRNEARLTSNLQQNAAVHIRRKPKETPAPPKQKNH